MTNKIIEAAKAAGGTTYTNRHYPGETACAFGPEALARFYAIAHQQGMEHLASEAIDTVARHGGSVEIEAAIRALPSQQDHFADANKLVDRHTLQAQGKHPAPCARFCEANAFRIEERQQARLIAELEDKVKAFSLDAGRWRFAASHNAEGRLNFGAVYDAWDGDGSFSDQIDAAIAAGKGEVNG